MYGTFKRHKENYEVNVFGEEQHSRNKSFSIYNSVITKDPNRIAQILLDLQTMGFPIDKAIRIFLEKMQKHDWFGL